jgi:hypothetical protein
MSLAFVASALAALVTMFVIAAGWHMVVFKDRYARLAIFTRTQPIVPLGVLSMLLQAIVLAYLFPLVAPQHSWLVDGLAFGLLMGVLLGSIGALAEAGKQNVTSLQTFLVLESSFYLLQYSVVGLVLSAIYRWIG